ncbi:MAG: hypothetical protein CMM61_12935 [Rhodospirillaceae bacterium]|nr:hypothetical protein [Rhodospirillaceae bacterium]|tara:strand:+ start:190 stop:444 length:255 start_codon:yes stop_codon:yes gene_type:complete
MKTLYQLVHYDVFRLFWLFVVVWLVGNYAMFLVEKLVWGEGFLHWGDLLWLALLAALFEFLAFDMGQQIVISFGKAALSGGDPR